MAAASSLGPWLALVHVKPTSPSDPIPTQASRSHPNPFPPITSHPIRLGLPTWPWTPGWIIDLIWELTMDLYIDSFATVIGFFGQRRSLAALWPEPRILFLGCVSVFKAGTRLQNSLHCKTFRNHIVQFWPRCLLQTVRSADPGLGPGLGAGASHQGRKNPDARSCPLRRSSGPVPDSHGWPAQSPNG